LGKALELLGYHVCHRAKPVREALGHDEMIRQLESRSYDEVFNIATHYTAFHDNPWFWLYKELDAKFPHSKFILSLREEQSWLKSAQNYFGSSESDFRRLVYGKGRFKGNEDLYLDRYRTHNKEVRAWFKNRSEDLLELDVIASPEWGKLCEFLSKPLPTLPFPHLNATSKPSSVLKRLKQEVKNGIKKA